VFVAVTLRTNARCSTSHADPPLLLLLLLLLLLVPVLLPLVLL
jgi:hypothetical protein